MSDPSAMPDKFDRLIGNLDGLPDVVKTRAVTVRNIQPFGVGGSALYIVQSYRQKDQGDTIFLEYVDSAGSTRLIIPARVADVIARQRETLASMNRRKSARRLAQERKDAGIVPAFARKTG